MTDRRSDLGLEPPRGGSAPPARGGSGKEERVGAPRPRMPGFVRGARYVADGAVFVLTTPSILGYAIVPVALTAALLTLLGGAGADWIAARSDVLTTDEGRAAFVGAWVRHEVTVACLPAAFGVALVVASVVQPVCALALDIVAREQGWRAARRSWMADTATEVSLRTLEATVCSLGVALLPLAALATGAMLFPRLTVPAFALCLVFGGAALAWNFLEYPLSRRDGSFHYRVRWLRTHAAPVLGFGLACATMLVVPGLGLLVVPAGIAGAARLAIDCERAGRARKKPALGDPRAERAAMRS